MTLAAWSAIRLTAELAGFSTLLLLLVGTPLAWWLARTRSRLKPLFASLVAMPLVLPPTVLGFYLLLLMGPHGPIGQLTQALGFGRLPFTFGGLALPLARPGFVTAGVLGFAHTVGEFGVVLMIGGNIPDRTRVLSVAIYDHVEAGEFADAHALAAGLVAFTLIVLVSLYRVNRPPRDNARATR